jgi:TetR/AcrR family transcriptional repressor of nem operon
MPRPRGFTEPDVLIAAREAFWATGFAGTSLDDLTAATGLGRGSIYGAFGSKRDLFLRVFDGYCAEVAAAARRDLDGDAPGAMARLSAYVRRLAAQVAADTARRGCLLAKGTAELSEHDAAVQRRARAALDEIAERLAAVIAQAQEQGAIVRTLREGDLARMVLATLRGIDALGKAGMDGAALRGVAESTLALISVEGRAGRPATG